MGDSPYLEQYLKDNFNEKSPKRINCFFIEVLIIFSRTINKRTIKEVSYLKNVEDNEIIINFSGCLVSLGPLRSDLVSSYNRWNNDFQTTKTLASTRPVILEEEVSIFEQVAKSRDYIFFTIYDKETLRPIGNTYLSDIDYKNRNAEFNIVIGEKDSRGKGYGTEVAMLILDYAFNISGLHNVFLKVYEFNENAIRAYKKAGFVECGRRRQSHFIGGRLWDVIYMEALATEFEGSSIKEALSFEVKTEI